MADILGNIRSKFSDMMTGEEAPEGEQHVTADYVELNTAAADTKGKATVRTFTVEDFVDVKSILDALREGNTIAIVNIKPLKDKDLIELKRAVNKLKKTTDAIEGDIAGFGDDHIIITPAFARIHRQKQIPKGNTHEAHLAETKIEEF